MTKTKKRTIGTRIQETSAFRRGTPFSSGEMARWLNESVEAVGHACCTLRTLGKLETVNGRHRKASMVSTSSLPLRTQYFDWERQVIGPREWSR